MALKPLNDRVLIKRIDSETTTAGGIIIPDNAKEKPMEGMVVAAGPGLSVDGERTALEVKEGDKVLFRKYAGTEISIGGVEHLIMREEELLAILG
ncbi:MAG: co-chaperone GroES [Deltaproteobacteria bacterium]|nr:co-chaperone GroES [Deltaproteobacteria bacterium]